MRVYIKQLISRLGHLKSLTILFGSVRVLFGFLIAPIFWLWDFSGAFTYSIILILIAEFIDSCEFYDNLKTITPAKQIIMDLEKLI